MGFIFALLFNLGMPACSAGISYLRVKKLFLAMKTSIKLNVFLIMLYKDFQTCFSQMSYKNLNGMCSFMLRLLRFIHTGMPASP